MYLEKTQMLTVSTAHLTYETLENLKQICKESSALVCYEKGNYGYFVYLTHEVKTLDIPKDLKAMLQLAFDNDCELICFDCDGELVEGYENYHF